MPVPTIESQEALRRDTARLGIVLFGLKHGQEVPELEREISRGIEICDTVSEWKRLVSREDQISSVREAAFLERISPPTNRRLHDVKGLEQLAEKVNTVRNTLERILRYEPMKAEDFSESTEFCHSLYRSL